MPGVAVLIDGAFFLKRFRTIYPDADDRDPAVVALRVRRLISNHLKYINKIRGAGNAWALLYRSFYYDARPYDKTGHLPISRKSLNYARTDEAEFRKALFDQLRREPNMAVRLGVVVKAPDRSWILKSQAQKALLSKARTIDDLEDADFVPAFRQKGVDMRLGVDMATLSLKGLADTIVLVTGDADFVPAAKLARREGVRIVLDPLWQQISNDLHEHIDGIYSGVAKPGAIPATAGNEEAEDSA